MGYVGIQSKYPDRAGYTVLDTERNELLTKSDGIMKSVINNYVNVKDFGAKGDGVTDDTEAIQNAIYSCPEGGTVFFPEGEYLLSTVEMSKSCEIKGLFSIIKGKFDINTPNIITVFSNLIFDGYNTISKFINNTSNSNLFIQNCVFKNTYEELTFSTAINITNANSIKIINNEFKNLSGDTNGIIGDNIGDINAIRITNITSNIQKIIIRDNTFLNFEVDEDSTTITINTGVTYDLNCEISSNYFENIANRIIKINTANNVNIHNNIINAKSGMRSILLARGNNIKFENNDIYGYIPQLPFELQECDKCFIDNNSIKFNADTLSQYGLIWIHSTFNKNIQINNNFIEFTVKADKIMEIRESLLNMNFHNNIIKNCDRGIFINDFSLIDNIKYINIVGNQFDDVTSPVKINDNTNIDIINIQNNIHNNAFENLSSNLLVNVNNNLKVL